MNIYIINIVALFSLHLLFHKYKDFKFENYIWIFIIFLLSIFIGFRNEVGGDWIHYENFYYTVPDLHFNEIISSNLVYIYINQIAHYLGIQIIGVNFICAILFMFALATFLNNTPNKWLSLAISFPIIIIILSMGYTRQGLAFSFSLFLIKALEEKKLFLSFIFITLSILSHKTGLFISSFLLFLYLWYHKKYLYLVLGVIIPIFFGYFFLTSYSHLLYNYAGSGQHFFSYGSLPRSLLIFFIAILFIIYKKKFKNMTEYQIFIYTSFAYMIIFLFPLCFTTSTLVDRLLLYLYPLKLVFISFANLKDKSIRFITFIISSIYFFYLITWVSFGKNSFSWVPYKFVGF
tara:strand:+ start:66 stop:1106 length:1041 start_codon:yes stop_codon:yes gene_type:complete